MDGMRLVSGGASESDLAARSYYSGGAKNEMAGGAGGSLMTPTIVPYSFPVISQQNASYINSGDATIVNQNVTTFKEEYVGVDTDSVLLYMFLISCSGYFINATLFFTICCKQKFRRATNYLLANLCISSILFLLAVNVRIIERSLGPLWYYDETNCVIWSVLRRIPQALASLTIVAISCDRSQAARMLVNRPCSGDMTKKILRIWLIAILATLPRGFLYRYYEDVETSVIAYRCSPVAVGPYGIFNFLYAFFHLMSIFMLPMCILIFDIYSTVQKIVFLKSRQTPLNHEVTSERSSQNTQLHRKQLQLLRNSCLFAALFLICWLPWGIYQQLGDLPKSIVSPEFRYLVLIHFKTVRYLPFTVTAFLPLLLVVLTYDANMFGYWKKCCGEEPERSTTAGANYRPNDLLGRAIPAANRMELPRNRPRPVRLHVNNVQRQQQQPLQLDQDRDDIDEEADNDNRVGNENVV